MVCTHGIFSNGAVERIAERDDVIEVLCTNTVPIGADKSHPKLKVISVANAFAEAIRRIHTGESVSALFQAEGINV